MLDEVRLENGSGAHDQEDGLRDFVAPIADCIADPPALVTERIGVGSALETQRGMLDENARFCRPRGGLSHVRGFLLLEDRAVTMRTGRRAGIVCGTHYRMGRLPFQILISATTPCPAAPHGHSRERRGEQNQVPCISQIDSHRRIPRINQE